MRLTMMIVSVIHIDFVHLFDCSLKKPSLNNPPPLQLGTEWYKEHFQTKVPGFYPLLGIGTTSSFIAMGATYPFRLITCQMQAYTGEHLLIYWLSLVRQVTMCPD